MESECLDMQEDAPEVFKDNCIGRCSVKHITIVDIISIPPKVPEVFVGLN